MIEVQGITRLYGDFKAVRGVSFSVDEGEIVGILGPNGAGKTTTIRMVTGFLPPTSGRVTVGGRDLFAEPQVARREIGYLPENVALYPEMRVREYLSYRGRLEGLSKADVRQAVDSVLQSCLLTDVADQTIGTLSKGYRQRVGLATAILHSPRVLVLDEPTVGLDPKQIVAIRELIRDLGRRHTILLSTHILPEVELLCDRVLIIDRGAIVAEGSPDALREQWVGSPRLRLTLKGQVREAAERLEALEGAESVIASIDGDSRFTIECAPGADLREAAFRTAVDAEWTLLELAQESVTLEDVFVRLTTQEDASPAVAAAEISEATASEEVPS
jgi:ABC-2 type transport system ATP-binding protein